MPPAEQSAARTRAIPSSIVARLVEGVRYAITGVTPQTWFGPSQPLAPVAPPEVAGRRFDYPTGYNLQYSPRAYEPVGFADLRALADNCDILRLVIETRKDQIEGQDWDIRPKKTAAGARPQAASFADAIAAAKAFFAFPDREHDFAQWTRQIAEEMFVTDATSLYKRRDRAGRVCAFEIIDGATIAPRIDAWGRTPLPPDVAYQQILHGVPAADFAQNADGAALTADELIYYPRNKRPGHVYGQSPVEQIIMTANIVTRRSLHQLAFYTDGNLTDAIFTAPSGWTADQIKVWQNYWNALFAGNLRERRHGTWVPDGTKYVPLKDIVLKDAFDEYLARIVCFCFSISPQPFVSQVNRATAETAKEQAVEEGLAPVLNWFKRLFDRLLQLHLGFATLEFVWIDDREMDPASADAIDVADVKAGIRTINEVRLARGLVSLPGGDRLMVATGAGYVPVGEPAAQTKAPPAQSGRRPFAKFNPTHWPEGAPDNQGGRFAPKGAGGGAAIPASDKVDIDSFGHPVDDTERAALDSLQSPRNSDVASSARLNGHGYVPAPGDERLLARAIFAEGSKTPNDMAAIAWAIINRIGLREYGQSMNDVIYQRRRSAAFSFTTDDTNKLWPQSATPETLTGKNATAWQRASTVAQGILNGSISDPTGGATLYFASRIYDGTPQTAPNHWFRHALRGNGLSPSPYRSSYAELPRPAPPTNFFFIENTVSNRHSRHTLR